MAQSMGFIGLGIMGKPMARNLLKAGFPLTVHNRSRTPVDELGREGATPASSPAEVAQNSEIIVTMLPNSPDVEQVCLGPSGVLEGTRAGSIIIDMSTISPMTARKVAQEAASHDVDFLDAPVSGGDVGAREGTLSIMVGGKAETLERCLPALQAMGKTIVHVGESGMGQVVKLANNILCAITIQGVAEALLFGAKNGADPWKMLEAISGGAAACWSLTNKAPKIFSRDFRPGFMTKLHHKDLTLAMEAAAEAGVPLPVTSYCREMYGALMATGRGDDDNGSLIRLLEEMAAFEVKAPPKDQSDNSSL